MSSVGEREQAARDEKIEKPGFLDKQRAQRPWLDHLVAAGQRYQNNKGDFFAAGATYFTVLALFPLIMVGFAAAGYVLINNPDMLNEIKNNIAEKAQGGMGDQLKDLMDQAIAKRATIGVVGLLGAVYAGLGWIANLRMALTEQWEGDPPEKNFLRTKLSDLLAMVGLGLAFVVSFGLSALGGSGLTTKVIDWLSLDSVPGISFLIRAVAIVISLVASTLLFTFIIAKMPRIALPFANAVKAGILTAILFEIFKYIATFYLKSVTSGPAGATFGPILGIMVFAFFSYRIILFATAWAATDPKNAEYESTPVPDPVTIAPRVVVREGVSPGGLAASIGAGIVAVLGISAVTGRKRRK